MNSQPRFLQGVFSFTGQGFEHPVVLDGDLVYDVPSDRRAQLIYFRAGNSSPELVYLSLIRNDKVMRLFPIGAKSDVHVTLAVVEDLFPPTELEVWVGAPVDLNGTIVLEIGFL